MTVTFAPRTTVSDVEEGSALAPHFRTDGLMPCVTADGTVPLRFTETERRFDPVAVYGDAPNPTIL